MILRHLRVALEARVVAALVGEMQTALPPQPILVAVVVAAAEIHHAQGALVARA